jgi:hypothetical protein
VMPAVGKTWGDVADFKDDVLVIATRQ